MDASSLIGKEIGNYRITAEINSGASGSVYKAEHSHLSGHMVAIKLLHTYLASPKECDQFNQEAQFLAMLDHPHILPLLDVGFMERQPYLILKYAAGGSLREQLKRHKPLPLVKARTILEQVGQALHYAHSQHIIHRDLKPENILFNTAGEVLLADFGIATKLSTTSVKQLTTIGGSPSYMAPEQFRGVISKEGDQYALGCIAYELMTGRLPFLASDFISMGFQHLTKQPPAPTLFNPQLPSTWEAAILKAMAKQRSRRHANIPEFLAALRTPFVQPAVPAPPPTFLASPSTPKRTEEHWWLKIGDEHYEAGRYEEALTAYEHVLRLNPNHLESYINKGITLLHLKRYEEALTAYEHVFRLNLNDTEAYSNKSVTLLHLKRYEEALAACEQSILLNANRASTSTAKAITTHHNLTHSELDFVQNCSKRRHEPSTEVR
jgi:serine/threonine protein kinase